jgi:hypothetical protein
LKILKSLAVSLFTFILFLSILIFGILFMVKSTVLNPKFITDTIDDINVSELIDEFVDVDASPETSEAFEQIKEIVPDIEPLVKERLGIVIDSVYDYLLAKKDDPEIKRMMGDSFMNADFVDSLLEKLDVSQLLRELLPQESGEEGLPPEFIDALSDVVADMEPDIKQKVAEISAPVFDYILGETDDIDLASVLRDTVLNADFIVPLIEKLDLSSLAGEFLSEQLADQIPEDMEFLTDYLDEAIAAVEPAIKEELTDAAEPLLAYLMGESKNLSIEVSLAPVMDSLEDSLRESLTESSPPEYAELSPGERERLLNEFFRGPLAEIIPSTFELDESLLGPDIPENITRSLADAEDSLYEVRQEIDRTVSELEEPLEMARQYVSYFQLAYTLLIVIIVVMVLGIVLILRDVRKITRRLGIPLLIYGAIEYAGVLVGRHFLNQGMPIPDIPPGIETWLIGLINDIMHPLEIFSLSLLIIGVALTVVSFVYRRGGRETVPESVD